MAHLRSVYPFHSDAGFGCRGPYMGVSVTGGMSAFHFDPFELYPAVLTNPNVLVVGEVGVGKSSTVKAFLSRSVAVYGDKRFVAILDPKGEYTALADTLGIPTVRLHPGGTARLNPMDPRPGDDPTDAIARQSLAAALVTAVLGRPLEGTEDAVLGWAIQTLASTGRPFALGDVVAAVQRPRPRTCWPGAAQSRSSRPGPASPVVFALDKLISRTLRGMFDGPTTIGVDWAAGPGVVVDLSAVYGDREALPLVMMAATSWLSAVLQRAGDRRVIQVIDEAWAAVRHGARHFQASLKLARTYGASTWLLCHRPSDLTAQADDGTADAKIAAGLLADLQTRVLHAPTHRPAPGRRRTVRTCRTRNPDPRPTRARPGPVATAEPRRRRPASPHPPRTRPVRHRRRDGRMTADHGRTTRTAPGTSTTSWPAPTSAALLDEVRPARRHATQGRRWHCPVPDHTDTNASVTMHTDARGHQRWRCWSGDDTHRGDAIDLVMSPVASPRQAIDELAARAGLRNGEPLPPPPHHGYRAPRGGAPATRSRSVRLRARLRKDPLDPQRPTGPRLAPAAWPARRRHRPTTSAPTREASWAAGAGSPPAGRRRDLPRPRPRRPHHLCPDPLPPPRRRPQVREPRRDLGPNPRLAWTTPGPGPCRVLVVCEGIPDALTAAQAGYQAVAILGAQAPDPTVGLRIVAQAERRTLPVVAVIDVDDAGRQWGRTAPRPRPRRRRPPAPGRTASRRSRSQ